MTDIGWEICKASAAKQTGSKWSGTTADDALNSHPSTPTSYTATHNDMHSFAASFLKTVVDRSHNITTERKLFIVWLFRTDIV